MIKILSVSTLVHLTVLVYEYESKFVTVPALQAQIFEFRKSHVGIHVIVVDVLEVHLVLTKYREHVDVIPDQMLGNSSVRLTQIERIYILVSTHAEVSPHTVLLLAGDVVENHNAVGLD